MIGQAIAATTNRLSDGHQFTREELIQLASDWKDMLLSHGWIYSEHRIAAAPVGRMLDVWVGPHPQKPDLWALFCSFETFGDANATEVSEQIARGGFSIAVFGHGVTNAAHDGPRDLRVGISPQLLADDQHLVRWLRALEAEFPETEIEVGQYRQHAFHPPNTFLIDVGRRLLEAVGTKLFDRVWKRYVETRTEAPDAPRIASSPEAPTPDRIVIKVTTPARSVVIEAPIVETFTAVQLNISEALTEATTFINQDDSRLQLSLEYGNTGNVKRSVHTLGSEPIRETIRK